jgi:hypothetical protein
MDRLHEVTYHRWVPSAGKVITGRALFTDYKAAMAASEILDRWLGSMGDKASEGSRQQRTKPS